MAADHGEQALRPSVTLYLQDGADREHVARLVKAMCSLNGLVAAIEIHADEMSTGPVVVPAHLEQAWNAAAWVLWNAMHEDDDAYGLALLVVQSLDRSGLLARSVLADAAWLARLARGSSWPGDMAQRVEEAAERVIRAAESGSQGETR